jgi:predicted XRE-type DNA-binding protein
MDSPTINILMNKISSLLNKRDLKQKEIDKRLEVLKTYNESDTNKKKQEIKINKICNRLEDLSGNSATSVAYYKSQIDRAESIYDREIAKLEAKKEEAIRKAEVSFDINKKALEDKRDSNIKEYQENIVRISEKLFSKSSIIADSTNSIVSNEEVDENADKVLIKLRAEYKQLDDEYDQYNDSYLKEVIQQRQYNNKKAEAIAREYQLQEQEAYNKKLDIANQIKQQRDEEEHQHKINLEKKKQDKPEEFLTTVEKKEHIKQLTSKKKEFKNKYLELLSKYKVDEELIFDNLLKHHIDIVINLEKESDVKNFFDTNSEFYNKKIQFEETIDKSLTLTEVNVYNHLKQLSKDDDIYYTFYSKDSIVKKKNFLKKYTKEYEHQYKEDS